MPRFLIILVSAVFVLTSCSNEEIKPEEVHSTAHQETVTYYPAGFSEGYWMRERSLSIVQDNDLNFNALWYGYRTYVDDSVCKLAFLDPIDTVHYELQLNGNQYVAYNPEDSTYLDDTLMFDGNRLGADQVYIKVDPERYIYEHYFAGDFVSEDSSTTIKLGKNGTISGIDGVTSFLSHWDYEKPVLVLKTRSDISKTYYFQDCKGGFQLFEIANEQSLGVAHTNVEIGELAYTFLKQ